MKKFISIAILCSFGHLFPHTEDVHQYIVREAFDLFKIEYPQMSFSTMADYVGTTENDPYYESGKIVAGAWQEDVDDIIVYGYSWPFFWNTHFWKADAGDEARWPYGPNQNPGYENAYQKSQIYFPLVPRLLPGERKTERH